MNDYKQECFKRLEYTQKYSKYNKEDLIEEIIEKDKQLDKYKNVIDKIKKYIKTRKEEYNNETELSRACINGWHYCNLMNNILELLEEVE